MVTSPNHVSPIQRHIPIELYPLIFQHITSKATLSNLCTVSRAFRHEAQQILYHIVSLSNDYDHIVSWCRTIVENPCLAMLVYSLSLPVRIEPGSLSIAETGLKHLVHFENPLIVDFQDVVKRALSSLSRVAELYLYYPSSGMAYVNFDMFLGHPFHLQVFEENIQPSCYLIPWLKFLSEQPGIRHWSPNIREGHTLDPDVLPLLTSAQVYSSALNILTRCPMIRALRVTMYFLAIYHAQLPVLKAFRHKLTSLSLDFFDHHMVELKIVRDAQLLSLVFLPYMSSSK